MYVVYDVGATSKNGWGSSSSAHCLQSDVVIRERFCEIRFSSTFVSQVCVTSSTVCMRRDAIGGLYRLY